jgi:hypothetical protein
VAAAVEAAAVQQHRNHQHQQHHPMGSRGGSGGADMAQLAAMQQAMLLVVNLMPGAGASTGVGPRPGHGQGYGGGGMGYAVGGDAMAGHLGRQDSWRPYGPPLPGGTPLPAPGFNGDHPMPTRQAAPQQHNPHDHHTQHQQRAHPASGRRDDTGGGPRSY